MPQAFAIFRQTRDLSHSLGLEQGSSLSWLDQMLLQSKSNPWLPCGSPTMSSLVGHSHRPQFG